MDIKDTLNRMHRSRRDQMFGGVCSGIAETTDTPVWLWRAGMLFVALWMGTGALVYVILWITLPVADDAG